MYESDTVSMLTTQLAILESQIEVRDKTIGSLRSELAQLKASAQKVDNDYDETKPYGEEAGLNG